MNYRVKCNHRSTWRREQIHLSVYMQHHKPYIYIAHKHTHTRARACVHVQANTTRTLIREKKEEKKRESSVHLNYPRKRTGCLSLSPLRGTEEKHTHTHTHTHTYTHTHPVIKGLQPSCLSDCVTETHTTGKRKKRKRKREKRIHG